MKKTLAILLVLTMLAGIIPLAAVSVSAEAEASGTCGDNLTWSFDEASGTLTISGSGKMDDYYICFFSLEGLFVNAPWPSENIKKVVIDEGVTSIGKFAFYNCSVLKSISIPASVLNIGEYAFGEYGFRYCSSLTDIRFGGTKEQWDDIDKGDIISVSEITVAGGNKVAVEPCGKCGDNLTWSYDVDTETLAISGTGAMYDGYYDSSYSGRVRKIPWKAYHSKIKNVTIEKGITHIGSYAFYECNNLSTVRFNGTIDEINAIEISKKNESLYKASIILKDNSAVTLTPHGQCGSDCFWSLDLKTGTLTVFGNGEIDDPEYNYSLYKTEDLPWYAYSNTIETVIIESGVTSIGIYAFRDSALTNITIPSTVGSINSSAFINCTSLATVNYGGTKAEWDSINIDNYNQGNDCLLNANIVFNGKTIVGWNQDAKGWYYINADGTRAVSKWVKDSKGWCYCGADGYIVYNKWIKDSKGWCYCGGDGYIVYNKWVKDSKGWCYVDGSGYMVYNKWVKDSKGWCYVDGSGYIVYNKWVKDSKGWCYVDGSGYMVYNKWVKDSKGWCYVDGSGYMVYNKWVKDSKGWCYVGSDGYQVFNTYAYDSAGRHYIGADGYMKW